MIDLKNLPAVVLAVVSMVLSAFLFYSIRPIGGLLVLVFGSIGALILMIGIPVVTSLVSNVISLFTKKP